LGFIWALPGTLQWLERAKTMSRPCGPNRSKVVPYNSLASRSRWRCSRHAKIVRRRWLIGFRNSARPKEALAAAKRQGTKLGGDRGATPSAKARKLAAEALRERAASRAADTRPDHRGATGRRRTVADGLNQASIPTARGQGKWSAMQVQRTLARI
jgi:hypothetical protein